MKIQSKWMIPALLALLLGGVAVNAREGMKARNDSKDTTAVVKKDEPKIPESAVIDEVVWIVGDEPILKSDVEAVRQQAEMEGVKWSGDPDCRIPEQIAVQKLFLHQAQLDSIEISERDIASGLDQQIDYWIESFGSKERLEEVRNQTVEQMKKSMHDDYRDQQMIRRMKEKLVENIKVTPAQVRGYFRDMPQDSLPFIPTTVEVEIITQQPKVPQEEINRIKERLREFTDRVTRGETSFATLARLYSEDGSARQGGEIGFMPRTGLDPAYANAAFALTDPKKISKVVESEFGFHVIQLIDKRGDLVNTRHILLKPSVPQAEVDKAMARLDSVARDIKAGKFTFETGATFISDDKDTRSNHGLMAYAEGMTRTSRFEMKNLPTQVARVVEGLAVDSVSEPFTMTNNKGKTVCAIIKLKSRVEGHRASITEDFQAMQNIVLQNEQQKVLREWVNDKIKHTYVKMADRYKHCDFEHQGWIK